VGMHDTNDSGNYAEQKSDEEVEDVLGMEGGPGGEEED